MHSKYVNVLKSKLLLLKRSVRNQVKSTILDTKEKYPQFDPHMAMILVGSREDSALYVKSKDKAAKEVL